MLTKLNLSFTIYVIIFLFPTVCLGVDKNDSYLCVTEEATGFYFEKNKWGRNNFDVSDEKFIIRKIKENELFFNNKAYPYGVYNLGENYPSRRCKEPTEYANSFVCNIGMGELFFSPKTGRFIKTYIAGYWDGVDNNKNTPNISRGRCSKI